MVGGWLAKMSDALSVRVFTPPATSGPRPLAGAPMGVLGGGARPFVELTTPSRETRAQVKGIKTAPGVRDFDSLWVSKS